LQTARESEDKSLNLASSIGIILNDDGKVSDVIPGSIADKAGVGPGMKVLGVNERRFSTDRLREALAATAKGQKLRLLTENQEHFRTFTLPYADGDRYPHLQRNDQKTDLLDAIFRPRIPVAPAK
jgi:predicted metalloprotease with PDZ domain